jgi:hypothetical protein
MPATLLPLPHRKALPGTALSGTAQLLRARRGSQQDDLVKPSAAPPTSEGSEDNLLDSLASASHFSCGLFRVAVRAPAQRGGGRGAMELLRMPAPTRTETLTSSIS